MTSASTSTATSSAPPAGLVPTITVSDNLHLAPTVFTGKEDAKQWLNYFKQYTAYRKTADADKIAIFGLLMRNAAQTWFSQLQAPNDFNALQETFLTRFGHQDYDKYEKIGELFERKQKATESVQDFVDHMLQTATTASVTNDELIRHAILRGLSNRIRTFVLQGKHSTVDELIATAKLGEYAVGPTNDDTFSASPYSRWTTR